MNQLCIHKRKMKQILLEKNFPNDLTMYKLIKGNTLDSVIEKIPYHKNAENDYYQFLQLFDLFLTYFSNLFPNIGLCKNNILEILLQNKYISSFLFCKMDVDDNNNISPLCFSIYKIIVFNFYHNLKVLGKYFSSDLEERGINYQKITLKTQKEVKKIMYLLKDLVFCNPDDLSIFFLFEPISNAEKKKKEIYHQKKRNWKTINEQYMYNQWKMLFDNYHQKKPYLKYFK